ncbi:hypothetical protein MNBD_PLANCTO03-240 [hydrothermal vent metagenome]|uniref:Amino acid transport protein n=1 Tax=hydrothermal vent metagenome TaxID=652676 RepID=A0A3B1DCJ0_9ZZZZ
MLSLDNPALLFSGLLLGIVGMGFFLYGKKQARLDCLAIGIILSIVPMVAHSLLIIWGVAAACLGGFFVLSRTT